MRPKRCRNALPGGLQEALEGSRRPLGLQVASGDAPGAFLGGSGRAPGAVLGGSRVVFRSLGGAKTASGAALGRLFRTSWRNLCGRPVGGPKMHQKRSCAAWDASVFERVVVASLGAFWHHGRTDGHGKKPEFHQRVVVFCTDAKDSKRRTRRRITDERP